MRETRVADSPDEAEESVLTAASGVPPQHQSRVINRLPWMVLAFLYVPLIYWSGFALKATRVMDYPSFYLAARLVFQEGVTPYGPGALDDYASALGRQLPPFVYPPPTLLAFWPLTAFSLERAFIVFTIVSHMCLLGSIWLILGKLVPLPRRKLWRTILLSAGIAYLLLSDAVATSLNLGQINLIALFFICLSLVALQEEKPAWRTALPLSIAVLLKTYPILLIGLLVARRKFRAALLTVLCCGVFVAVAAFAVPTDVWASWRNDVLPAAVASKAEAQLFSHSNVSFVWNQSITGLFTRLFGQAVPSTSSFFHPGLVKPLAILTGAGLMGLTMILSWLAARKRETAKHSTDDLAAFVLMVYLVAPVSWDHHLVFVLPSALIALELLLNGLVRGETAITVSVALFLVATRMNLEAPMFQKQWWSLLASMKFLSVLGLWAFFASRLYRKSDAG